MNKDDKKVTEQATAENAPSLKDILKAEAAEIKAKQKAEKLKRKQKVAYDINGKVIPDLNVKHVKGIESKKSWYGFYFVLPWIIGMVLFFIIPLVNSLLYSFATVVPEEGYMELSWVGLENYTYLFKIDETFKTDLLAAVGDFLTSMPIVVIVSLILALILNSNFKGKTVFRGIFFVPVIVATGVVMNHLTDPFGGFGAIVQLSSKVTEDAYSAVGTGGGMDFTELLNSLQLPTDVTAWLSGMITDIFNTIWTCGIPVVLFIAGLQTIPAQLYEASKVEGATKWEEFWYITLPSIGQTLLLVIIFTLIELLTQTSNPIINQAYALINKPEYGMSSAMLWVFFAIIGVIISAVIFLFSRFCLKRWE